ncbi:hypothetical protein NEIFL0001_0077 [Neisseria flavescens SK114]|nr:hypothetical protein NEIFL0001_0077 [Neisseria flavescens SK114]
MINRIPYWNMKQEITSGRLKVDDLVFRRPAVFCKGFMLGL